jgi:hemolysin III
MLDRTVTLSLDAGPCLDTATAGVSSRITAETANQWTHAVGFLLSLAAVGVMWDSLRAQADWLCITGCLIYLSAQVALYAASTLSHSFEDPVRRRRYRTLDQVCILLMIVAGYTAFALTHLRDGWWWLLLAAMWLLACTGIALRILRGEGAVAFVFFALLGWMPIIALGRVAEAGGVPGLALVIGGGLAYTGGMWFLVNDNRHPYLHAAWHLSTITGAACHFFFLLWFVAEWPMS